MNVRRHGVSSRTCSYMQGKHVTSSHLPDLCLLGCVFVIVNVLALIFVFSVQHILGNLILQLLLGIPLELVHKGFEVGMVYLGGVLAGQSKCTQAAKKEDSDSSLYLEFV